MKRDLEAQLQMRGYRHAVVLGPFGGRAGEAEYTVALYDATGRVHRQSLRGTSPSLRGQIARLPEQGPPPAGRQA